MKAKHFNQHTNFKEFFSKLRIGEYFTYGDDFSPKEIIELAEQVNYKMEYAPPHSEGYKLHGCQTMLMIDSIPEGKKLAVKFAEWLDFENYERNEITPSIWFNKNASYSNAFLVGDDGPYLNPEFTPKTTEQLFDEFLEYLKNEK